MISPAIVSIIFTVLVLAMTVIGILVGMVRGKAESILRFVLFAVCAVISALITAPITSAIAGKFSTQISGLLSNIDILNELTEASPTFEAMMSALPAALISIAVFPLLFLILQAVALLITLIVCPPIVRAAEKRISEGSGSGFDRFISDAKLRRTIGGTLGGVQMVIGIAFMLVPVILIGSVANDALNAVEASGAEVPAEVAEYGDYARVLHTNPVIGTCSAIGFRSIGISLIDASAPLEINGSKQGLGSGLAPLFQAIGQLRLSDKGGKPDAGSILDALLIISEDSDLVNNILDDTLAYASLKLSQGEEVFGITPGGSEDEDSENSTFIADLLSAVTDSGFGTPSENANTLLSILRVLKEYGLTDVDVNSLTEQVSDPAIGASISDTLLSSDRAADALTDIIYLITDAAGTTYGLPEKDSAEAKEMRDSLDEVLVDFADEFAAIKNLVTEAKNNPDKLPEGGSEQLPDTDGGPDPVSDPGIIEG